MKSFFLVVALINVVHFFDKVGAEDINKEQGVEVRHVIAEGKPAVKYVIEVKSKVNRSPAIVSNQ